MTKPAKFLMLFCALACVIVTADSWRPRTAAEKVADAELVVHGVATLAGLPLGSTQQPVKRSCTIVVLGTLWPTNEPSTNIIVVDRWAWGKWPDTWWNYNSQTGVYFLERTATALRRARAETKRRDPQGLFNIPDEAFGTNVWRPLERFEDWYEPVTNMLAIRRLIERSKK